MADKQNAVLVLDMQPIDPPIGGGRLRLLGLYHGLGSAFYAHYVGTYDWPGEQHRDHYLSKTLREVDIPLSGEHFAECRKLQDGVGGKTVIDVSFHQLAHLSPQFVSYARNEVGKADVVSLSHPWVFPLVKSDIDRHRQTVIYDSQNVEGYLRYTLLHDGGLGTDLVREVIKIEYELCHFSDLILVCSHDDRELFHKLYAVPYEKMKVVPNGVFTEKTRPVSDNEREGAKKRLGLQQKHVAIFIGSNYQPNIEAAKYIIDFLAPHLPEITFLIAGGVGDRLDKNTSKNATNVVVTGFLSAEDKALYLAASDLAVNPMFSGSGTNIKMFEFMAAGLPILSTETGARGIEGATAQALQIAGRDDFPEAARLIAQDEPRRRALSAGARALAEEKYSWERISSQVGLLLARCHEARSRKTPFFSVIVPSYNRHDNLNALMQALSRQQARDFEVIVVDQSSTRWDGEKTDFGFDLFYLHTDVRGAVKARNLAAFYARGTVLAFTDDDCIPSADWLYNAKRLFDQSAIIGIEGLIKSDKLNDPRYRPVTNDGFPGIGFMTANLFLKSEVFARINGFDERFDHPHFREDTDLAWRAMEYGDIPFGNQVIVFHPPHLRTMARESLAERNKFFEKDALLLRKHPQKYIELFLKEKHWQNTEGFWKNFLRGAKKYNVDPADYGVLKYHPERQQKIGIQTASDSNPKEGDTHDIQALSVELANQIPMTRINLSTAVPAEIQKQLPTAAGITDKVRTIIRDKTHGGYFETSVERYNHYFSVAAAFLPKGAIILDIGNAPGHVGIGLHLMGMKIQGLNLNDCWLSTYPSPDWLKTFNVIANDIEKQKLPYEDNFFDAIYFTEVLEHIAIKNPVDILADFRRVLKPGGLLVLSTPNVCNISNVYALLNGKNIFWQNEMFYGSVDRHNREYTPDEVQEVVSKAGFQKVTMYGFNCHSNWRNGGVEFATMAISKFGDDHPLLRNTVMLYAFK